MNLNSCEIRGLNIKSSFDRRCDLALPSSLLKLHKCCLSGIGSVCLSALSTTCLLGCVVFGPPFALRSFGGSFLRCSFRFYLFGQGTSVSYLKLLLKFPSVLKQSKGGNTDQRS